MTGTIHPPFLGRFPPVFSLLGVLGIATVLFVVVAATAGAVFGE